MIDGRRATLDVVTNSVLEIGLDKLVGELPIQINYPEELLAANLIVPAPAQRVVIEVLETVRATPEVVEGIKAMRSRGHKIALDDFSLKVSDPALLGVADTVKIDVSDYAVADLEKIVRDAKRRARRERRPLVLDDLNASTPRLVVLSDGAYYRTCLHEAAHALVGCLVTPETARQPSAVTTYRITPRPEM